MTIKDYKIVAEYITEHGITEIRTTQLLKEIIKQVVRATSEHITPEDIRIMFDTAMWDISRDK